MSNAIPDSGQHDTASPVERLLQMLFTEPPTLKASNELAAIPNSEPHDTASPVERLLQMLFTEPPTLKASNELALSMIHRLSSFTFLKKTKKELRRHSVSEPPKAASPIERMLKALFSPPRSLSASNKSAEAILISLSGSPYVTFRGTIKPQRRDSDSDSALWQPESPSRPSWRDEAYWLDQLDGWEQSRYHTTREILPDHEWPRRAEELYHSLVDECFKVFERSADAKAWLIDALPMMLWCIEAPTAGDFFEARESNAPMVPFIAREVPESYDRLIRHLDNSDHKAGEPLPDGYRKFLLPDESTYLRLAAYCRRIKRSHEAQCYFLHKESERRV